MTNEDLSRIERRVAAGDSLGNASATLLLEQLRSNAADMVRVRKRLADAERDLELLEQVRKSIEVQRVLIDMIGARDNSAYQAEHAQRHLRSEYKRRSEFYAAMVQLLAPGDAGRGEGK